MSKFRNICWWIFFMAIAVCLQAPVSYTHLTLPTTPYV